VGPVWNPATGEQQAQVALPKPADVDAAVARRQGVEEWRDVSVIRRARVMFALRDLIERHLDELSVLVADEHGKVVSDAKGEVIRAWSGEYACGIPTLLKGEFSEQVSTDVTRTSFASRWGSAPGSPRSTSRSWCPCGCTRSRSRRGTRSSSSEQRDPSGVELHRPPVRPTPGCPRASSNVVHGDKVAVEAILAIPASRRCRRRLDADRQVRAPAGL